MIRLRQDPQLTVLLSWTLAVSVLAGPRILLAQSSAAPAMAWVESLKGDLENQLRWPVAAAAAGDDELLVADAHGNRLFLFLRKGGTADWTLEKTLDLSATPRALAFDGQRYIVALRQPGGILAVESPELQIRKLSVPPDLVAGALAPAAEDGFWVFDAAESAILQFDSSGQIQRRIDVDEPVTSLSAGSSGDLYAAIGSPPEVRRYTTGGELKSSVIPPGLEPAPASVASILSTPGGDLYVVDRAGGRILRLDSGGRLTGFGSRRGWVPGLLMRPTGLTRFPDGRLAVVDQGNGRVQIFRLTLATGGP